jgi:hypothetical protein
MTIAILAVDPGKTSGIAMLTWGGGPDDKPALIVSEEATVETYASIIENAFLTAMFDSDKIIVVCERFVINQQTVRNSQAPYSLEQIGVLKHLCRVARFAPPPEEIKFQAPVDAKNMFPNPALKKLEIWHKGGEGHALDAIRHALLALTRQGWIPRALLDQ